MKELLKIDKFGTDALWEIERELNEFAKSIPVVIGGLNYHPTVTQYIGPSEVKEEWPFVFYDETRKIKTIKINNYNNLDDFISYNKNELTHLIIDTNSNLPDFLNEGNDFVSMRCSSMDFCMNMVEEFGRPVTTTSANKTTEPQLYFPIMSLFFYIHNTFINLKKL